MTKINLDILLAAGMIATMSAGSALAQQRVFLSGSVVMADGSPLPKKVDMELVCSGVPQKEGQTDAKGQFGIQLGSQSYQGASATTTQSASGNLGQVEAGHQVSTQVQGLMGCGLRASLDGYVSTVVELSGRRLLDDPNVGTIILSKGVETEGVSVSATSLQAPKDAKKAFDKGKDQAGKRKFEDAEKSLNQAVKAYPKYAEAWYELAVVQQNLKKNDEAEKSLNQAVAADAKYTKPYLGLALLAARQQNWQEAAKQSDILLGLDPYHYAEGYYYNAVSYFNLKNADKALASIAQAVKLDPQHTIPQAEQLYGYLLTVKGDYKTAVDVLQAFLQHAPANMNVDQAKALLAQAQKMAGGETAQ